MSSLHSPSTNEDPDPVGAGTRDIHEGFLKDTLSNHTLSPASDEQVLLVDQRVLRELEEDLDSPSVAQDFAKDYARSWDGKYQRLAVSLEQRDQERAIEAVMSVKVTSIMVGAVRLAHLAARFEQLITNQDLAAADQILTRMKECGAATLTELQRIYLRAEASTALSGLTEVEEPADLSQKRGQSPLNPPPEV